MALTVRQLRPARRRLAVHACSPSESAHWSAWTLLAAACSVARGRRPLPSAPRTVEMPRRTPPPTCPARADRGAGRWKVRGASGRHGRVPHPVRPEAMLSLCNGLHLPRPPPLLLHSRRARDPREVKAPRVELRSAEKRSSIASARALERTRGRGQRTWRATDVDHAGRPSRRPRPLQSAEERARLLRAERTDEAARSEVHARASLQQVEARALDLVIAGVEASCSAGMPSPGRRWGAGVPVSRLGAKLSRPFAAGLVAVRGERSSGWGAPATRWCTAARCLAESSN